MKSQGVKVRTRVKVGRGDPEFSVKYPNVGWKSEQIPEGLPDIDLEAGRRPSLTTSPPPGRPDRTSIEQDRKRPLSGSESEETNKKQKESSPSPESNTDEGQTSNRKVDMLDMKDAKGLDNGQFTSTEGFSPATPAKPKNIPDLSVLVNSPVFHNKQKNIN